MAKLHATVLFTLAMRKATQNKLTPGVTNVSNGDESNRQNPRAFFISKYGKYNLY